MDSLAIIGLTAAGTLIVAPVLRRGLKALLWKSGHFKEGVPMVTCKQCHTVTHQFHYPVDGGALCSKCANWE